MIMLLINYYEDKAENVDDAVDNYLDMNNLREHIVIRHPWNDPTYAGPQDFPGDHYVLLFYF